MPAIGLDMYDELSGGGELSDEAKILLNGGKWEDTANEKTQSRMCGGLKKGTRIFCICENVDVRWEYPHKVWQYAA